MKNLIIYAHPSKDSFNGAIKNKIEKTLKGKGHDIKVRNLYDMMFNSVLSQEDLQLFFQGEYPADIQEEHNYISWADHLYFVYPTWWYSMPALLKGYVDRVFSTGFAFRYTENGPEGLLGGRKALVFQTASDPLEALVARDMISAMNITIGNGILQYCDLEVLEHKIFPAVHHVSTEAREQYLQEVEEIVLNTCKRA
ncbi:NAD(P)H-dependent oxidoreductase [Halalkalibacter sp. APA_J-10(15)]|uniref:NAD(P)H-dependent oxidoreductase n=1 Tax=unclassified Halalkalibacter TaxID=2893063 RepID=UPI001FF230AD|nr:NAD(P)H-dependent oxidoreductase [Halalkalibacter sp. APA_J-10(15)]MCK0473733.1 NAD(P)H-dependent oxidoreductase [Halalkalibacter sp. APA_J-10(15)]